MFKGKNMNKELIQNLKRNKEIRKLEINLKKDKKLKKMISK